MISAEAAPTDLSGKTCLITGANGGIGLATAEHFAALGAKVLTTDLGREFSGNFDTEYRSYDLASNQGLNACSKWIKESRPDVLFNNAAVFQLGSILNADLKQFDQLFKDGDSFHIGQMRGDVIHTPGHTPACLTYVIGDAAFVGDTLFMPDFGTARCDFPGGSSTTRRCHLSRGSSI